MKINIKTIIKTIVISMLLGMILIVSACGKKENDSNTTTESKIPEATMIYIYHPEDYKIVVEDERYQIKQPDSTAASIEEIMSVISPYYEEKMQYTTYMLDSDNVLTVEFIYIGEYNVEYYLLAKAAIIRTLFQISDISDIRIILYSEDEEIISDEVLSRDSIYYYDEDSFE